MGVAEFVFTKERIKMTYKKAVFAGSFDPFTLGHLHLIQQAARIFDSLIVVVAKHPTKVGLFTAEERQALLEYDTKSLENVKVEILEDDLLVNFARARGVHYLVRGLRGVSDFEYEQALADANAHQAGDIETIFIPSPPEDRFISSSLVREVASLQGKLTGLVTPHVAEQIKEKMASQ